mgnify:CR=1 FL=1
MSGFSEEQKLEVLSTIHDGWVIDNSSETLFNKKVNQQTLSIVQLKILQSGMKLTLLLQFTLKVKLMKKL